jgi:hypothetical protein
MRFQYRLQGLMLAVLATGLFFTGLKAWSAKRETLVLRITKRGDPMVDKGVVTLDIKDVERDEDGCVAGFTVCEQTVKVDLPQGLYPWIKVHVKREEDPAKALQRAMEDMQKKLAAPP